MSVVLALAAAVVYGTSDFLAGLFSRRVSAWQISIVAQISVAVCAWITALIITGDPTGLDLLFGALSGLGTGIGIAFLYSGLANGRMSVVAPVSAVGSAIVPLAVGLAQGDNPSRLALIGVAVAFPAIWLIARPAEEAVATGEQTSGLRDAIVAGLGFGLMFATLGQVPEEAGYVPIAVGQSVSVITIIVAAMLVREAWLPRSKRAALGLIAGPIGFVATVTFMLASQSGMLSIVSVITSLYPASTVLLAWLVLSERIGRGQGAGLAVAAVAVSLVALG